MRRLHLEALWIVQILQPHFADIQNVPGALILWRSPGLMDTFSLMKEGVFHVENEECVPNGI